MKLLCTLVGLCMVLGLSSCKDDDSKENEANLIGTWQATDLILRDCTDETANISKEVECPGEDCIRYTFELDSNSTRVYIKEFVLSTGSIFETGTFSVGETKIDFCVDNEGEVECTSSKYTVNSTTLVLLAQDADRQCTHEIKFIKEEEVEND